MLGPLTARRLVGALALAVAACAARGAGGRAEAAPRQRVVLVEVLPRSAEVVLDGRALGPGSRAVPAPPGDEHVLRVAAPGYVPDERTLAEHDLAGVRVGTALVPVGYGAAAALDFDDPEPLALAAAFIARSGDPSDAIDYAQRALALDPGVALAHRAIGDALARQGDARAAARAWSDYLRLAPDAPDADAVAGRLEAARDRRE